MTQNTVVSPDSRHAAHAADLLVTVAATLNERLAVTALELARSQSLLREASDELMTAFRGAADRIVAAQKADKGADMPANEEYALVLDHLYRAVQHLQSHDLVNQLIDAQKCTVDRMREKFAEALHIATPPIPSSAAPEHWIERSRAMLDCIVAGIRQMDEAPHQPGRDKQRLGSVDLF